MKLIRIIGWCIWSLGFLYAGLGLLNGDKVTTTVFRDTTIHKHGLWDSGEISKAEAKVAMFELNEHYTAFNRRIYWTLSGLLGLGSILLVIGRKHPNQTVETTQAVARPTRLT